MPDHDEFPIQTYRRWLAQRRRLRFDTDDAFWQWSAHDLEAFWRSLWDHFGIDSPQPPTVALADGRVPGAVWFPGTRINYANQVFRHADAAHGADIPAVRFRNEALHEVGRTMELGWAELRREVASLAVALRGMGVRRNDRVAGCLPNAPQTVVAFLACASLGAIWSVVPADMPAAQALARLAPLDPKVLIACDGVTRAGEDLDLRPALQALLGGLPTVEHLILWPCLDRDAEAAEFAVPGGRRAHDLRPLLAGDPAFEAVALPFDHPLWIAHRDDPAGGPPLAIVHGHGGLMLEHLKLHALHHGLGAGVDTGDVVHWTTSPGEVTWALQVGALLVGATIALFDGAPCGPGEPGDAAAPWRYAAETGTTFFGTTAGHLLRTAQTGLEPTRLADLSALRTVAVQHPPGTAQDPALDAWLATHLTTGAAGAPVRIAPLAAVIELASSPVAAMPARPDRPGEVAGRALGVAVAVRPRARDDGEGVVDPLAGELVCTRPMPSMPLYLWKDEGDRRYVATYFDVEDPAIGAVWHQRLGIRLVPHPEDGTTGVVLTGD